MSARYAESERALQRALRTIPLGAQTFSKSMTQYPLGISPYFAARAKGATLWDVDGNKYVDFISALCAVTLGYADPDVNEAVSRSLENGTVFSLSNLLEAETAERIVSMVPSAEMVRFGKNGSDATAGAIRIARAATGRDHVLVCGYHGWQDWFIGSTTRNAGVPGAVCQLTHSFPYNDLPALERKLDELSGSVAAVILEPMNVSWPHEGYLEGVKSLASKNGAVLIFDEMITGFRFSNGGAQSYFGVVPDITTLGKGIANGFPLSAVCGRRDLMMLMEEIFFSFTMGGETMSLAAACATLDKLEREPVVETLSRQGGKVLHGVEDILTRHALNDAVTISGHPSWSIMGFSDRDGASQAEIKTLYMQEVFARGVLSYGSHNMSYAHHDAEVGTLLSVYDEVFGVIASALAAGTVRQMLRCDPLVPLFRLR